ncbi:hypothetical protein RFI_29797, partial [Reticulomyxa filosa]
PPPPPPPNDEKTSDGSGKSNKPKSKPTETWSLTMEDLYLVGVYVHNAVDPLRDCGLILLFDHINVDPWSVVVYPFMSSYSQQSELQSQLVASLQEQTPEAEGIMNVKESGDDDMSMDKGQNRIARESISVDQMKTRPHISRSVLELKQPIRYPLDVIDPNTDFVNKYNLMSSEMIKIIGNHGIELLGMMKDKTKIWNTHLSDQVKQSMSFPKHPSKRELFILIVILFQKKKKNSNQRS